MSALPEVAVCPPDHRHGQVSTCYIQHRCRCLPCRSAHAAMTMRRAKLKAYGRFDSGLVDAAPVRAHLAWLAACGMSYKRVAEVAGVSRTGVRTILYGRQDPDRKGQMPAQCGRAKADAILAVRPNLATLAGGARIPARGVHRRVQALVALGWSVTRVAEQLGMRTANLFTLLGQDEVTVAKHRLVAAVYERLSATLPPAATRHEQAARTRALRYAAARGWEPPLAWDDIDHDPAPAAIDVDSDEVDDVAIEEALASMRAGTLTTRELTAAVQRAGALGLTTAETAARLQVSPRHVTRLRTTSGRTSR